jgi:hypothetical protein
VSRPEKSLETKLAEIDRNARELGAAVGRVMTGAAAIGCLLPGQTADSPNLNEAQRARHRPEPDRVTPRVTEQSKLRLAPGYRARLAALAETEGLSAAQLVEHWIGLHERALRDASGKGRE